jgi:hypothetical protein
MDVHPTWDPNTCSHSVVLKIIIVAHSVVLKKNSMGSVHTEEFNTGQWGGGLTIMTAANGGLRGGSPGAGCGGGKALAPCWCSLRDLPCRCCLLLGGALAAALMKGPRRLRRRGQMKIGK